MLLHERSLRDERIDNLLLPGWTAALPFLTTGLSALSGLFGKKQQQQQVQNTDSTTNQSGTQNYNNTTTPTYDPYMAKMKDYIMGRLTQSTQQSQNMAPWLASGIKNINQGADLRSRLLQGTLASRGLGSSPMAAYASAGADSQRNTDIVNYEQQMPILQRQFQSEDMGNLSKFFSSLPVGNNSQGTSTNTGTSNTQGTSTGTTTGTQGGGIPGMVEGAGQGLMFSYGLQQTLDNMRKQAALRAQYGGG